MRTIVRTTVALFVLWGASFGLSFLSLGAASLPLALAIAAVKAIVVALFFMELVAAKPSVVLTVAAAVVLAAILIGLMVADVVTREPSRSLSNVPLLDQSKATTRWSQGFAFSSIVRPAMRIGSASIARSSRRTF